MNKNRLYISTIAQDAAETARQYGVGLEIAEYCTAYNMDERLAETDAVVQRELNGIANRMLHAPFNELFPCAIDPKARTLARYRYRNAIRLARSYGAAKVIIHGGYHPRMYYPCWYQEQSVLFWRAFLKQDFDVEIVLENVLEEEPGSLLDIVKTVDDPRLRLCLDVGHANVYSPVPVQTWLEEFAPWLSHFHLHNNRGDFDAHLGLAGGSIPMAELLRRAERLCPGATYTLEVAEAEPSIRWLMETGLLM